jgi:fibronectin-binding autotransporter adhesin
MVRCKPPVTGFAFLPSGLTRLCSALIFLLAVEASSAAIWVWTGSGGNVNWSTLNNWDLGTAPASASTTELVFAGSNNTGTAAVPLNQNIAAEFYLNKIKFELGSGSFFLGGGTLSFVGGAPTITQTSSNAQSIANTIIASTNSMIVLTLAGDGSGVVTLSGGINAGSGNRDYAVTKTGTSTFSLTGASDYDGLTTISAGVLNIRHGTALGSTALGTTVASGAALQIQGNINVATEALTLNGSGIAGEGAFRNMSGNNNFAGAITLNTTSTIGSDSGTLTLSGVVSGTGGLTKTGAGTLVLSGPASNTYTGPTAVNQGTLILAKPGFVLAPAITIGGAGSAATVQLNAAYQLYGAPTTINSGGQLNLNNFDDAVGVLTLSGGSIVSGTGLLYLSGGLTSSASTTTSILTGNLSLYNSQIFNIASGSTPTGEDVVISATIGEYAAGRTLTKQGSGKLVLSGANTYSGLTTISAGILSIQNSTALGTTAGGTTVSSGGSLQIQGNIIVGNEALTLNGSGIAGTGAFRNISGNNNFGGAVTLGTASTISSDAGNLTLTGGITNAGFTTTFAGAGNIAENGVISGTGGLTKSGGGTVTLSGANTFTGTTTISAGTLQVNTNGALGTAANGTTGGNGAVLRLNNVNYSTAETLTLNGSGISNSGALANTGTSTFAGPINAATNATINAGGGTLTLTGGLAKNGTTLTFSGGGTVNITNNGITGSSPNSDLVVDGTTVILSAANSYNGPTTVQNSGTLQLGNNNVLPTSPQTALTVNSNSVFNLASRSDSVASLSGDSSAIVRNSVIGSTSTLTVNPANGITTTFAGGIAGTEVATQGDIALQKNGSGTLILTGANSYSGATTINGGTLTAAAGSGSALKSTSSITVNSGGTLMLGANNQINDTAPVTLAGGTFSAGNFSEGTDETPGLGALTLTASSLIDFGSGAGALLTLAGFTPGSFTLTIANWTGNSGTIGDDSTDRLIFSSDQSANLSSFVFTGYGPGAMEFDLGNGYYEITPVPVPEPSTYVAAVLALGAIGFQQRRRILGLLRRV